MNKIMNTKEEGVKRTMPTNLRSLRTNLSTRNSKKLSLSQLRTEIRLRVRTNTSNKIFSASLVLEMKTILPYINRTNCSFYKIN